jgi:peptide/nickel transport system substrate-binding protein
VLRGGDEGVRKISGAFLATSLIAALFASGCGGDSGGSDVVAQQCDPEVGGSLKVGVGDPVQSLDPNQNPVDVPALINTLYHVNEPLLRAGKDPKSGELDWRLAESMEPNADFTQWTIKLRPGVRFSDGEPFGADDVIFSLDYLEKGVYPQLFGLIENMTSPDPLTVVVKLSSPQSQLDREIASSYVAPMLEADFGGRSPADYFARPVGTGPFTVADFKPGRSIALERNDNYWEKGRPYLDTVDMEVTPDPNTRVTGLQSGSFGMVDKVPADTRDQLGSDVVFHDADSSAIADGLYLSPGPKLFSDPDVLHALPYAVDREQIVASAYGGLGSPATKLIAEAVPYSSEPASPPTFDLDKAKDLMASSSFPDGGSISLMYPTGDPPLELEAQIVQQQLKQIGIDVQLQALGSAEFIDRLVSGNFDMFVYHYDEPSPTVAENLQSYVYFGGYFGWSIPAGKRFLHEVNTTVEPSEVSAVSKAYENFIQEQGGQVPLVSVLAGVAATSKLADLTVSPFGVWSLDTAHLCQ